MLFTFKRDEEGRERIYVEDVCVATLEGPHPYDGSGGAVLEADTAPLYIEQCHIDDAIERADEAGFWERKCKDRITSAYFEQCLGLQEWLVMEVTVNVPVADNTVLSVTVGGDES